MDLRTEELRMSFGDHLEELRSRLIKALIGLGVAVCIAAWFGTQLMGFLAQPLLQAQNALGFPPQAYTFSATAGFMDVYVPVVGIAAVILAGPWIVFQAWAFIVSGLYEHERRVVHVLWPFSLLMTVLGLIFAYTIMLPVTQVFFYGFATNYPEIELSEPGFMMKLLVPEPVDAGVVADPDAVPLQLPVLAADPVPPVEGALWLSTEGRLKVYLGGQVRVLALNPNRLLSPMPEVGQYIRFAAFTALGIVVAFQLPVVMLVVGRTGLVDPAVVSKGRKYAFFVCFAAGALLTPADLMSMFVLAIPLYGLFELGLVLMRLADPGRTPSEDN